MKKKILVISWFYPPINSSEGLVTYKLINNSKFEYDVFTQSGAVTSWSYGANMDYENSPNVKTIFSSSKTIDEWVEETVEYFRKNSDKYYAIMTRSMPEASHEIGSRIKKEFPSVYWFASFGDPIKVNPYTHIACSLYSINSPKNLVNRNMSLRRKLSPRRFLSDMKWELKYRSAVKTRNNMARIEDAALEGADCLILNNESQKKHMLGDNEKYLEKAMVLPHSYYPALYPKKTEKNHKKIRFVFLGLLDYIRNATPLFNALKLLNEEVEDLSEKVEFLFYGNMSDADKLLILNNDLLDIVRLKKNVSYADSLRITQEADWLLHFDGNIGTVCEENIFFAAKVADYFGSGNNIFAITMQDGAIVDILRNANALVLSYSAEEIKNYLYLIIEQGYKLERNEEYIRDTFESSNVAKLLDAKIETIVK